MAGAGHGAEKVTRLIGRPQGRVAPSQERLVQRLRGLFQQNVCNALPGLLDEMDDRLYELVERSQANQLQTHYFAVMRELRLVRSEMESRFMSELLAAVRVREQAALARRVGGAQAQQDGGGLALMDEAELEESVAVANMATKIRNQCQQELFALERRVAAVLSIRELDGDAVPYSPEVIAGAASRALGEVDTSIDVRIVLLKLVERRLVHGAACAYAAMNELLISVGVLPDLRVAPKATRPARTPSAAGDTRGTAEPAPVPAAPGRGEWVKAAARRMEAGAGADADVVTAAVHGADGTNGASESGAPTDATSLAMLHTMMSLAGAQSMNEAYPWTGCAAVIEDMSALQRDAVATAPDGSMLRDLRTGPMAQNLSPVDNLMIDVVAMMFDYVLADDAIVDSMRALVARMQIPILKVAIIDKTFFARRTHPARQFVNELAAIGARMNTGVGRGDPTFDHLEELVNGLLKEFEADLGIFTQALETLSALAADEERDAEESAWRSAQLAKERERLEAARQHARTEVDERMGTSEVPEFIREFLQDHWRHLLATRLYQDGENSKAWRAQLQTMDNLLWSVRPKQGSQDRDRLLAMLPFLLHRLKAGMAELSLGREQRRDFLKQLSTHHIRAVRGDAAPVPGPATGPALQQHEGAGDAGPVPRAVQVDEARSSEEKCVEADPYVEVAPEPPSPAAGDGKLISVQEPDALEVAVARLRDALCSANTLIYQTAQAKAQCKGMGTTAVALKLHGGHAICANAGDSRIYRLRDAVLTQLSRDHTYRQQLLDMGKITQEEAHSVASNLIVRAIGIDRDVKVDAEVHALQAGDVFLLCSDGLSDMLDDTQIRDVLAGCEFESIALQPLAHALIAAANDAGGRDNISVALLRVDELGGPCAGDGAAAPCSVSAAQATHSGRVRPHNEDCVEVCTRRQLAVLADGMGGHNAGEVASAMTVRVVLDAYDDTQAAAETALRGGAAGFDFETIEVAFWDQAVEAVSPLAGAPQGEATTPPAGRLGDIFVDGPGGAPELREDAALDPCLAAVLGLAEGDWVEFRPEDGTPHRARVSYVAPDHSRLLFTGRDGQKVADASAYGLALEMRNARLRRLDQAPLLDRAMSELSAGIPSAAAGAAALH
jgi:serine/threonine protein phosphatase PrpC